MHHTPLIASYRLFLAETVVVYWRECLFSVHEVGCSILLSCFLFSLSHPFFNSVCLFSSICVSSVYLLNLPHYLFMWNYFPLRGTQRNKTNFRFSNTFAVVNQVANLWSCAVASFWNFKIICAPSIISKAVHNDVFHES